MPGGGGGVIADNHHLPTSYLLLYPLHFFGPLDFIVCTSLNYNFSSLMI